LTNPQGVKSLSYPSVLHAFPEAGPGLNWAGISIVGASRPRLRGDNEWFMSRGTYRKT
jgi:hypothetical protein